MTNDISKHKKLIESAHNTLLKSYEDTVQHTAEIVLKAIKSPIRPAFLRDMIAGYGKTKNLEGNTPEKFVQDVVDYLHSHFKNRYTELPDNTNV